ncbi:MAG TPA: PqqD family protein [Candidatus Limnocylindrales bacterium]|nr:PqqD family protein [Candidatus Limnocylindrales bacterium]
MNRGRIAINPMLAWREIDGQVVIISPEDSVVHELNETGSFIWKQIDFGRGASEIARNMVTEYALPASEARADAEEFLECLAAKGLLQIEEERNDA